MGFPVTINGTTYTEAQFLGRGYVTSFPEIIADVATVAGQADTSATNASASAASALTYRNASEGFKNEAEAARDLAVAAAVSADYAYFTTSGTSSAYTVDADPNVVVADGFSARINFHAACSATPTLAFDGGTAYELVDGLSLSAGGTYRSIGAGEIRLGMNLVIMFDSAVSKFVVVGGFPIYELSRDLNCNGYAISNAIQPLTATTGARTFSLSDANTCIILNGSTARTWTVPSNASVAIPQYSSIDVFNNSSAILTLTASSGVTVNGVVAGSIDLLPYLGGHLRKIGTDTWIYIGAQSRGWTV